MAGITFTMKAPEEIIKKLGLGRGLEVQKLIDSEVLKRCEPFVPKKTGKLIESGELSTDIGSGTVSYDTPYAAYQYYGVSASGRALKYSGAPERGSYWFFRMKAVHGESILALAAKAAGGRAVFESDAKAKKKYVPKKQKVKTVLGGRKNPIF